MLLPHLPFLLRVLASRSCCATANVSESLNHELDPLPPLREVFLTPTTESVGVRMYASTPTTHAPEPSGLTARTTVPPILGNHQRRDAFSMLLPQPASGAPWESWEVEGEYYNQKGRLLADKRASPVVQFARKKETLAGDVEAVPVEVCAQQLHGNVETIMGEGLPGYLVHPEFTSTVVAALQRPTPTSRHQVLQRSEDQ